MEVVMRHGLTAALLTVLAGGSLGLTMRTQQDISLPIAAGDKISIYYGGKIEECEVTAIRGNFARCTKNASRWYNLNSSTFIELRTGETR